MTVQIGNLTFDRVRYDAEGDVLYLHRGDPSDAVDFDASPEGHALRFDRQGVTSSASRSSTSGGCLTTKARSRSRSVRLSNSISRPSSCQTLSRSRSGSSQPMSRAPSAPGRGASAKDGGVGERRVGGQDSRLTLDGCRAVASFRRQSPTGSRVRRLLFIRGSGTLGRACRCGPCGKERVVPVQRRSLKPSCEAAKPRRP